MPGHHRAHAEHAGAIHQAQAVTRPLADRAGALVAVAQPSSRRGQNSTGQSACTSPTAPSRVSTSIATGRASKACAYSRCRSSGRSGTSRRRSRANSSGPPCRCGRGGSRSPRDCLAPRGTRAAAASPAPVRSPAPVHQVAHREQPVERRIETQPIQALTQAGKMPMHIAHREVAAGDVARDSEERLLHGVPGWRTGTDSAWGGGRTPSARRRQTYF